MPTNDAGRALCAVSLLWEAGINGVFCSSVQSWHLAVVFKSRMNWKCVPSVVTRNKDMFF